MVNGPVFLSDVRFQIHRAIFIEGHIDYSYSTKLEFRTIRPEARLAPVTQDYSVVFTPEVGAVVSTSKDSLDSALLNNLREQSSVDGLAR